MNNNTRIDKTYDKRSEPRTILDQYYSVEFLLEETGNTYQFKLRDLSPKGLCIVVNESSAVLKYVKLGEILDMKFHPPEAAGRAESLKTRIRHITKNDHEPFKGHFFIGLSIIEKK